MGQTSLGPAGDYAAALADVVYDRMKAAGGDDSGRWLAARTSRAKDYWRKIFRHEAPLNVNDVAEVSDIFDTTPFALSLEASSRLEGKSNVTALPKRDVVRDLQTMPIEEDRYAADVKNQEPDEDLRQP